MSSLMQQDDESILELKSRGPTRTSGNTGPGGKIHKLSLSSLMQQDDDGSTSGLESKGPPRNEPNLGPGGQIDNEQS